MNESDLKKLTVFYKEASKRCEAAELPFIRRSFIRHFLESSMNEREVLVHQELQKQIVPDSLEQRVIVPENIPQKDARRPLRLLMLEALPDASFHISWEGQKPVAEKPPRIQI